LEWYQVGIQLLFVLFKGTRAFRTKIISLSYCLGLMDDDLWLLHFFFYRYKGMQVLKMVAKTDAARKVQVFIALNESLSSSSSLQNVKADPTIAFPNTNSTGDHHHHNNNISNNNDTIGKAKLLPREIVIPSTDPLIPSKTCNVSLAYPVIFGQKPSHHNVSDLFRGHDGGLEDLKHYSEDNNHTIILDKAICEFAVTGQAFQMAHGMQQLYRCIAWWREHPNLPWVLVWKKDPRKGLNRFMTGMIQAYRDVLNVTIVQDETVEPRVTALISQTTRSVEYTHYAMRSPDDAAFLRDAILSHYQLLEDHTSGASAATTTGGCRPEKLAPVIGILDRRENRKLINVQELAGRLNDELGVPTTPVTYFEDKSFLEQLKFMSHVDILLSSHGAQLVSIPFMPRCGGIMEFFQRGYFLSYYFGSLAAMSNLTYSYLYTGWNTTLERRQARGEFRRQRARERNICLNVDAVLHGVHTMIERWKTCCDT
jgi:hypothetical protein